MTAVCDRIANWLERHSRLALLGWSIVFLGVTCLLGATKLGRTSMSWPPIIRPVKQA